MVILNDQMVEILKEYIAGVNEAGKDKEATYAGYQLAAVLDVVLMMGEKEDNAERVNQKR